MTNLIPKKKTKKIAILIGGAGSNMKAIIDAVLDGRIKGIEVALVISHNKDAKGVEIAKSYKNIKTLIINHRDFLNRVDFDMAILQEIKKEKIDLVCLAGFMRMLSADFLRGLKKTKIINIHPSLLPKFKGENAIKDALFSDAKKTGCSVHYVTEEMDSGEIILQREVNIEKDDNLESLKAKIHKQEHIAYVDAFLKLSL